MKDKDYLITGRPFTALTAFVTPIIIGSLFQQFYTMVDSAVVGRFVSEKALGAVGASYALTNVFIMIAAGGGIAGSRGAGLSGGISAAAAGHQAQGHRDSKNECKILLHVHGSSF